MTIDELRNGIEFIESVLEWRSRENQSVGRVEQLERLRRFGLPVLDALTFVQDD